MSDDLFGSGEADLAHLVMDHDPEPRFMVLHRARRRTAPLQVGDLIPSHDDPMPPGEHRFYLHGGVSPSMFKTLRMADKTRRLGNTWVNEKLRSTTPDKVKQRAGGVIVMFDPNALPRVAHDEQVMAAPGLADRLTEAEFAERQVMLWTAHLKRARIREYGINEAMHLPVASTDPT